ncbi:MAG: hypothetical protein ABSH22_21710, partial [Tepidisphaeraceae bacterium]
MYRGRILLAVLVWGTFAQFADADIRNLLFPGNVDPNTPIDMNIDPAGFYVNGQFAVGFTADADAPNSPYFPFTAPDPCSCNLVSGAVVPNTFDGVLVANGSAVNVSGSAQINTIVELYDTSSLNLMSGTVQVVAALGSGSIVVSGGSATGALTASGASSITFTSGEAFGGIGVFDQSGASISGGVIYTGLEASDNGTIN